MPSKPTVGLQYDEPGIRAEPFGEEETLPVVEAIGASDAGETLRLRFEQGVRFLLRRYERDEGLSGIVLIRFLEWCGATERANGCPADTSPESLSMLRHLTHEVIRESRRVPKHFRSALKAFERLDPLTKTAVRRAYDEGMARAGTSQGTSVLTRRRWQF